MKLGFTEVEGLLVAEVSAELPEKKAGGGEKEGGSDFAPQGGPGLGGSHMRFI